MNKLLQYLFVIPFFLSACSLDNLVDVEDPEAGKTLSEGFVRSREGALGLFNTSLVNLKSSVNDISRDVGIFTDEITVIPKTADPIGWTKIEGRYEESDGLGYKGVVVGWYSGLNRSRVTASQTRQLTRLLNDSTLNFTIAGGYALEGYSILLLAENFCSGVPLTKVTVDGVIEYGHSVSTVDMFKTSISLFDSALAIEHDSSRYNVLAKIGKARAYMGLGNYEEAFNAIRSITQADKFELAYTMQVTPGTTSSRPTNAFWAGRRVAAYHDYYDSQIINNEGINGLVWYSNPSAIDPRLPVTIVRRNGIPQFTDTVRQAKFAGNSNFPLARWIEGKLIESEYYLSEGDVRWLESLNEARRTVGLPDTTDPGSVDSRVNLLFRERAYWLYLEGHRLADMRRLVRQYGRSPHVVYPVGRYGRQPSSVGMDIYGDAYVFIPDFDEVKNNYKYDGCINRNP